MQILWGRHHIITECRKYEVMRIKNQIPRQISQALGSNLQSITNLLNFLKNIQSYNLV